MRLNKVYLTGVISTVLVATLVGCSAPAARTASKPSATATGKAAPAATATPKTLGAGGMEAQCQVIAEPFLDSQSAFNDGLGVLSINPADGYAQMRGGMDTFTVEVERLPEGEVRTAAQAELDTYNTWLAEMEVIKDATSLDALSPEQLDAMSQGVDRLDDIILNMGAEVIEVCQPYWR